MPNIKPISELRNYTNVVKEVKYGNRVYLTKNGHGHIAMIICGNWMIWKSSWLCIDFRLRCKRVSTL